MLDARPIDDKALKALDAWLKHYRSGKMDFASQQDITKESFAAKFAVLPKGTAGTLTWQRDLEIILEQVVKIDSAPAATALLEVAAIGLDPGRSELTIAMDPFAARAVGEKFLAQCTGTAALEQLTKVANGEVKFEHQGIGMRAAALRFQGLRRTGADRALLEHNLAAAEMPVRLACADALRMLADEEAVVPLAAAVDRETNEVALGALVQALHACFEKYMTPPIAGDDGLPARGGKDKDAKEGRPASAKPAVAPGQLPESSRIAVRAVIQALGRTSWRADMELVQFLFDFRTKDAVPVLIDVLQRFKDHPEDVQSGKVSGLLLHRVHDTLVSMTGSILPADAPDKWRELWEKDKDSIAIVPRDAAAAKPVTKGGTVSRSFCGIPVQGSRVLFIVDLSGSMNFAMKGGGTGDRKAETRLDFAKKQMHQVIADMPETSRLNFITYNGLPKAEFWNKDLVVATAKSKERAIEFVEKMRADGGTNMWAGLDEGLKMKSLVYGERYATTVDEIFLVSDGAPSVGEVIDPMEILRLVTETNRFSKVRINTIFITSPNERDPRNLSLSPSELMKRMAEQNGGRFVQLKE